MRHFKNILLMMMLGVSAGAVYSQEVPKPAQGPEQLATMMQSLMNSQTAAAVAAAKPLASAMIDAQTEAGARPETAVRIAEFKRNLFNSLKEKGFSVEQAMQIVVATQPPAPVGPR